MDFMIALVNALCISPLILPELPWLFGGMLFCILFASCFYVLGRYTIREEISWLVYSFWICSWVSPACVIFGIYRIFYLVLEFRKNPANANDVVTLAVLYFATGIFLLMLRTLSVIFSVLVYRHFGEGLKHLAFVKRPRGGSDEEDGFSTEGEGQPPKSIADVVRATYGYQRDAAVLDLDE